MRKKGQSMSGIKTPKRMTSQREVIATHNLLAACLVRTDHKDDQDRYLYKYIEDYDDDRVARECGESTPLSSASVANLRRELFGPLYDGSGLNDGNKLARRIAELEKSQLELQRVVKTLCDGLGVSYQEAGR